MHLGSEYVEANIFIADWYDREEAGLNSKGELFVGVESTMALEKEADACMVERGFRPFFYSSIPGVETDIDGWYNFFLVCREGEVEEAYVEVDGTRQEVPDFIIHVDEETRKFLTRQMVKLFGSEQWRGLFPQWAGKEYR